MQPIVKTRLAELRELSRLFQVRRLDLFGSAARGDFDSARSDVDFVVEFERHAPTRALDTYISASRKRLKISSAVQSTWSRPAY